MLPDLAQAALEAGKVLGEAKLRHLLGNLGPRRILQLLALPHLGRRCLVASQPRQRRHVGVALAALLCCLGQVGAFAPRRPARQLLLAYAAIQARPKLLLQCLAKHLRHALQRRQALGAMHAGAPMLLQRRLVVGLPSALQRQGH